MKTRFSTLTLFLFGLLLSACSSKYSASDTDWYLRSEISYWEPREEFRLRLSEDKTHYFVRFKIQYDGAAYHFKISDKVWSADKNCGVPKGMNNKIQLNSWVPLNCNFEGDKLTPLEGSYTYSPKSSGQFQLEVKMTNGLPQEMRLIRN